METSAVSVGALGSVESVESEVSVVRAAWSRSAWEASAWNLSSRSRRSLRKACKCASVSVGRLCGVVVSYPSPGEMLKRNAKL